MKSLEQRATGKAHTDQAEKPAAESEKAGHLARLRGSEQRR